MHSILIHPETKEQAQAFEKMAQKMHLSYIVDADTTKAHEVNQSEFMKKFNTAIPLEDAREISLKLVRKLWQQ